MFDAIEMAPADPIMGLTEEFKKDPNPEKVNLGVGVYQDENGTTPVLDCVKRAEKIILRDETTKNYLSMHGSEEYGSAVRELIFGAGHEVIAAGRATTAHTPGGTGGLRVAGEFVKKLFPEARIWVSDPTWANHAQVFAAAGLEVAKYPYRDPETNGIDFEAMLAALADVPAGDVVLLHGCCHNPTGIDPTPDQWARIADVVKDRNILPLVDFAYHGLADGIRKDTAGIQTLCRPGCEMLIASSFSKNFGLYRERVGALTVVAGSADAAGRALSHVKKVVRANYSNPPSHGAAIVTTVLGDGELCAQWTEEVRAMRERINGMRELLVETLRAKGVDRDFSFITRQRGMFSFSGLTKEQVDALRQKYSIYIVGSGRINVAGMTPANMDRICTAIADVLSA